MENHPIPQDVTGFKFKLIGSVTVKQFLYLLGFGILATVAFVLQINLFLKIPFMLFFGLIGVSLAFVPIEGRPMDVMITNFVKAIPSENRYLYKKRGANISSFEFLKPPAQPTVQNVTVYKPKEQTDKSAQDEKKAILLSRLRNSSFRPDEEELTFLKNIKSFFGDEAPLVQKMPDLITNPLSSPRVISIEEEKPQEEPETKETQQTKENKPPQNKVEEIQKALEEAKQMQGKNANEDLSAKIKKLEQELQKALSEKEDLARKVTNFEVDKAKTQEKVFKPSIGAEKEKEETQNVKFVSPSSQLQAGFPTLPDVANIVMGIVRDPRGKTLPNILVEVVEENNVPVRAFKTNALGQFASATPLPNGTYKIYFEDPSKTHSFETVEINLTGEIFNPIEVTSVDSREKLRRELFGANAPN